MTLVHNERRKYLAASFDRASTASLAVGVFGQLTALDVWTMGWKSLGAGGIWFVAALVLHFAGRQVLGGLRE
ncbi:hypothetical protein ACQKKX_09065 [Neorhizobium sp. NPDC001467]|uniref:hypothetical protein n=1 Tax=Neorhizobium sp. NPDC001467 TaxID=3390595 RepID=UPI003CFCA606